MGGLPTKQFIDGIKEAQVKNNLHTGGVRRQKLPNAPTFSNGSLDEKILAQSDNATTIEKRTPYIKSLGPNNAWKYISMSISDGAKTVNQELIMVKNNPHPNTTFKVIKTNSNYPMIILNNTSRIVYAQNRNNDIMQFYITNIK